MHRRSSLSYSTLSAVAVALAACGADPTSPALTTRVVSVVPAGGAIGVDPNAPIVVTFSHPMQAGVEQYAAVHEGDVTGPVVSGTWAWSDDRLTLTFTPAQPLRAQTRYTLHLGGGMRATDHGYVDYGPCATQYGGRWATQQMMSGGGMMGGIMMGRGWRHPNGTFGMVFTFTTA
ncbi:MAG TPA: Ig-like domain-containing protein [Gemmatimonadales bacterium]|nr:Ig-like domain-containing protein [Gemmatimonadales bacterium]